MTGFCGQAVEVYRQAPPTQLQGHRTAAWPDLRECAAQHMHAARDVCRVLEGVCVHCAVC